MSATVALLCSAACSSSGARAEKASPAASVSNRIAEGDAAKVHLTAAAEARLGLKLTAARVKASSRTRSVGGDVLPSSGRALVVVAPVAGSVRAAGREFVRPGQALKRGEPVLRLTPVALLDRDLRAQTRRAVSTAEARLSAAEARVQRSEKLVAEGVESLRVLEEARAERDVVRADYEAARSRTGMLERAPLAADVEVTLRAPEDGAVRQVNVGSGGMVAAGAPLYEFVGTSGLWVKVTLFVGDLRSVRAGAPARVRALTEAPSANDLEAIAVQGPPTADSLSATFDMYYSLPEVSTFRPGERVAVTLSYGGDAAKLVVPWAAVVHDVHGTAWVYELLEPHVYARRRVEIERVDGSDAILTRGLRAGAQIVSTGAAELYGTEFGAGK